MPMKLEIGNFYVKDVVFGKQTAFENGILTINEEEAISVINAEGNLKNIELHIACPGESVRIFPAKEIVEARARKDGRSTFPGYIGEMALAGEGSVYALKGMAVTAVDQVYCTKDGLIDMSGPAAELTHFAKLIHVCFTAEDAMLGTSEAAGWYFGDFGGHMAHRKGAARLAEYLGRTVLEQEPEEVEVYDFDQEVDPALPRVAVVKQLSNAMGQPGLSTQFYGRDTFAQVPTVMCPTEVLDGAYAADTVMFSAFRDYTYDFQNAPIIKDLYQDHGKKVNFVGFIPDSNDAAYPDKVRTSNRIVALAQLLKLDSLIVVACANGHSEISFFTTIIKLEEAGFKPVGICQESPMHGGFTQPKIMLDPRTKELITTGADGTVLNLPAMERVIGNLSQVGKNANLGTWEQDAELGPSLHEDGSLVIDTFAVCGHDGNFGWSNKACRNF